MPQVAPRGWGGAPDRTVRRKSPQPTWADRSLAATTRNPPSARGADILNSRQLRSVFSSAFKSRKSSRLMKVTVRLREAGWPSATHGHQLSA